MAYVRMHSPPARTVKRPNQRWDRQRPIGRGAGPVDDHGGSDVAIPATGATAGIPGTFTPPGCVIPLNLVSMTGIIASPATPWTSGQFVQTQTSGAAGRATWSGTSWVGGAAPLAATYDPGEYTVEEVKFYVTEHPDEIDAVHQAELNGKNRSTLLTWLEEQP